MATRTKKEVKPVVTTSFPDLLGEEERRKKHDYPTEVRIERLQQEDLDADGLLDELLNDDDDSLTNSYDDRVDFDAVMEDSEMEKASNSFLGELFAKVKTGPTKEDVSMRSASAAVDSPQVIFVEDAKARRTPSDATSRTSSERSADHLEADDEIVDDDDDDEISVTSSNSSATQDLLERAHDRLNRQHIYEEIADLRQSMEHKDKELEQMAGQLRRAVSTKCDLVLAHTELERHHEFNLRKLEEASKYLLKANFGLVEEQASTDVVSENMTTRYRSPFLTMSMFSQRLCYLFFVFYTRN
jgi:hypothetical protein